MADYNAKVRSNYFKVKNRKKFDEFLCRWTLRALAGNEEIRLVGFTTEDMTDHGAIQSPEEDGSADFCAELAAQLNPDEVAIFMEVGSEKTRYLFGHATAVNSKGETGSVSLEDIYEKARKLTTKPKLISECTY